MPQGFFCDFQIPNLIQTPPQFQDHQRFPKIDTDDKSEIAEKIEEFTRLANDNLEPINLHIAKVHSLQLVAVLRVIL